MSSEQSATIRTDCLVKEKTEKSLMNFRLLILGLNLSKLTKLLLVTSILSLELMEKFTHGDVTAPIVKKKWFGNLKR